MSREIVSTRTIFFGGVDFRADTRGHPPCRVTAVARQAGHSVSVLPAVDFVGVAVGRLGG